jgi:hypothetical protein
MQTEIRELRERKTEPVVELSQPVTQRSFSNPVGTLRKNLRLVHHYRQGLLGLKARKDALKLPPLDWLNHTIQNHANIHYTS